MANSTAIRAAAVTAFVLLAVSIAVLSFRADYVGVRTGKADENYLRSTDCRTCHEDHFASWRQTHHSRMTQSISPGTVQGDFSVNNSIEYLGVRAKMERRNDGFFMDLAYPNGTKESFKIERTVGSRRIEQYVTSVNGQYFRLPLAYDLMQKRWMSLNGSFFYPDADNFKQHWASWDQNCVFCHNVKAQPNFNFQTNMAKTEVSELGIACGACHGQGAEHAEQASSPFTRFMWRRNVRSETRIVDPLELDSDRAMMICGHCHGQRVPEPTDRIRQILSRGDPYDAGNDLSQYYRPIHMGTTIGTISFASRFWSDGTPRLTAYEYQGIMNSSCFQKGDKGNRITCTSCHAMHDGDPKGMITEKMRSNIGCTQCHSKYEDAGALSVHTMHDPSSAGSNCYSCHMPEIVYGVQTFHKSHMISVPEPKLTINGNVPNACNQCHIDKSVNWSVEQARKMWPDYYTEAASSSDVQFDVPEGVRGIFGGDALTRALMADAITKHGDREWAVPLLIEAFSGDNYPIVRYFAANGLAKWNNGLAKPDYLGSPEARSLQTAQWVRGSDPAGMSVVRLTANGLRKSRKDVDIEVGE